MAQSEAKPTGAAAKAATTGEKQRIELVVVPDEMRDLAPMIHRQRLVIEGLAGDPIDDRQIRTYLSGLSDVCEMTRLIDPVTHRSEQFGWAGWVHWETSGAHFYAWDEPVPFFSVDIYTCKSFDPVRVAEYTADFFDASEIVAKGY